jgi:outer membrane protein OmpA-like peptidoglycan-associated protein
MANDSVQWKSAFLSLLMLPALLISVSWAQSAGDVSGATDYAGIERFPGSVIAQYTVQPDSNYRLALGRLQRVNGRVTAGREERIRGTLTRITYQIPAGFSGAEVFEHFLRRVTADNTELFRCQGRACGSSNFWANDILGNRILYGPEQEQFYAALAASNAAGENTRYYMFYVITRGNRSVYAHLDIVDVAMANPLEAAETPEAFMERLQQDGSVIVRGISFDDQDALLEADGLALAARALQLAPQLQVFVVAHLRGTDDIGVLLERSRQRAGQIVESLQREGVEASRLRAEGVGPLSPACAQAPCSDRVEIVLSE